MSAALEKVAVEVGAKSIQAGTYLTLLVCPFLEFMNIY